MAFGGSPYLDPNLPRAEQAPVPPPGHLTLRERPFINGLLLTIVTLGIYPYYWHYVTHDELCRQVGRPNQEKALWYSYVVIGVITWVASIYLLFRFFGVLFAGGPGRLTDTGMREFAFSLIGIIIVLIIIGLIALVIFVIFVAKQYEVIRETRRAWGMPHKVGPEWFFGFYFGSLVVGFMVPFATAIGFPVAYYNLQEHYNELYRRRQGHYDEQFRRPAGQMASTQPPPAAYPPAQDTAPARPTWNPGYRVGDRAAPTRTEPRTVEQTFQCPRCHSHVTARGAAGTAVEIRCSNCGEGGSVTLPA